LEKRKDRIEEEIKKRTAKKTLVEREDDTATLALAHYVA
jgi:hypothetical protein